MELRELTAALAVAAAVEKVVKARRAELRDEADRQLMRLNDEAGVSALDLSIGAKRVGRLTVGEARPAIGDQDAYGRWAFDSGLGKCVITIETSDPRAIANALAIHGEDTQVESRYVADPRLMEQLAVAEGGQVMCRLTGEVGVPGTYVAAPRTRINGCKPEDVGDAMRLAGDDETISGLLAEEGGAR